MSLELMDESGPVRTYYDSETDTWVETRPVARFQVGHISSDAYGYESIRDMVEADVLAKLAAWFCGNDFDFYGDRKTWWEEIPQYEYEEDEDGQLYRTSDEPIGSIWRFTAEQGYWPEVVTGETRAAGGS